MKKNWILSLFASLALPVFAGFVGSTPEGYITWSLPETTQKTAHYLAIPLTANAEAAAGVSKVTANTLTLHGANWSVNQFAKTGVPYFARVMTGLQSGRVMLITANSSDTLTVDTSDNSSTVLALNPAKLAINDTDRVEVYSGETLSSVFGDSTSANPLQIAGGKTSAEADRVGIYNNKTGVFDFYFFNATNKYWENEVVTKVNANSTIIYPESCLLVERKAGRPASQILWMGEVPTVTPRTKVLGKGIGSYTSTRYPVDMTLGKLFMTNWIKGTSAASSDTVSLYNSSTSKFDTYYRHKDGNWRKMGDDVTIQNDVLVPAGIGMIIAQQGNRSGDSSFVRVRMPYVPYRK